MWWSLPSPPLRLSSEEALEDRLRLKPADRKGPGKPTGRGVSGWFTRRGLVLEFSISNLRNLLVVACAIACALVAGSQLV